MVYIALKAKNGDVTSILSYKDLATFKDQAPKNILKDGNYSIFSSLEKTIQYLNFEADLLLLKSKNTRDLAKNMVY